MKKELLFSSIGHLILFVMLTGLAKSKPQIKPYPEVFQISVVSLESNLTAKTEPSPVAVLSKKPEKKSLVQQKPKQQSARTAQKTGQGIGLKLSSKGGKHSYYIETVLSKIANNWINPFAGSQIKITTTIGFVIAKDGELKNIRIEKSSGNEIFDRAAERAVIITKSVPQLSGEFAKQESLIIHLEFEYAPQP
ncbi:MAG: energy transducer TonB [candidate division WOR-3 bacterium]